jgi:hypothetical protein
MSMLESRISEAAVVLKSFFSANTQINIDSPNQIISEVLSDMGIDDSEFGMKILEASTTEFNDFANAFKAKYDTDSGKTFTIPVPRLKIAWMILKGQDPFKEKEIPLSTTIINQNSDIATMIKQLKPIGQWSDIELVSIYEKNCPMQVEEELSKRAKDRPCIIFNDDGKVNVETSLILLREARNCPTPSTYLVDKKIYQVYKVGEFPMNVMYECPIHSDVLLVNGYCEQCGTRWDLDSDSDLIKQDTFDKYVFLRLLSETTRIDPIGLKMLISQSFDELTSLYPKILLKYNELKEEEKLPTLKRRISKARNGDPFRIIHKEY